MKCGRDTCNVTFIRRRRSLLVSIAAVYCETVFCALHSQCSEAEPRYFRPRARTKPVPMPNSHNTVCRLQ